MGKSVEIPLQKIITTHRIRILIQKKTEKNHNQTNPKAKKQRYRIKRKIKKKKQNKEKKSTKNMRSQCLK